MERDYTNNELSMLITSNSEKNEVQHVAIMDSLKTFHDTTKETLSSILAQTSKTNGSVRDLLLWRANIQGKMFAVPIIVSAVIASGIGLIFRYLFPIN